ncbi:ABC transporter substrate-binding protein [uncultured Roseobacter sp.]|uniref:ABC transporter substrate-binding protein n=1 Tax=uncultured Roseobacter sp. TaxID=114847 RepID=UPI0026114CE0|nr:ABC transporter substrate-binding protein [uncultured Roseobacter sp.]
MFRNVLKILTCVVVLGVAPSAWADRLSLYIDADFSISRRAAEAIDLGVHTALAEVGYQVSGIQLDVIRKDHRANSKRTLANLRAFRKDPQAIAIVGGSLSPPYLTNKQYINENGILLLLPWSAAGPITRADAGDENWIFRLSVDDTKAGPFLVSRAVNNAQCRRTALLLIDTGWGRANSSTMQEAFNDAGQDAAPVFMFSAGLGTASARSVAESMATTRPDCVIMLASADTGALLVNELHEVLPDVKIISHWGILAGEFEKQVSPAARMGMHMEVLQTCGLEVQQRGGTALTRALNGASQRGTQFDTLSDVPSSTGFVHGYDLTKLFLAALEQAVNTVEWGDAPIAARRDMVRLALENLPGPIEGILKSYERPFRAYSMTNPDAHEALGMPDLCMAAFSEARGLVLADSVQRDR